MLDQQSSNIVVNEICRLSACMQEDSARVSIAIMTAVEKLTELLSNLEKPSVIHRPTVMRFRDKWKAQYGPDSLLGVMGFGDSPEEAMEDFNRAWKTKSK